MNSGILYSMQTITKVKTTEKFKLEYFDQENDSLYTKIIITNKKTERNDRGNRTPISSFIIPKDTKVLRNLENRNLNYKDLHLCIQGSPVGYTKLRPMVPEVWKTVLAKEGTLSISDIHSNVPLAFECEWPPVADEWVGRKRLCGWPSKDLVQKIQDQGVRVVPSASNVSKDESEWKLEFIAAENMLIQQALEVVHVDCFRATKLILDWLSISETLCTPVLKHTFFYFCEETGCDQWTAKPGLCLVRFMLKLLNNSKLKCFPNYFMKDLNMLDSHDIAVQLQKCTRRLMAALYHPFVCLYSSLDKTLVFQDILEQIFDDLIGDIHEHVVDSNDFESVQGCFVKTVAKIVQASVYDRDFQLAEDQLLVMMHNLNRFLGWPCYTLDNFLLEIFSNWKSILDKWTFAFYIDMTGKGNFMSAVNLDVDSLVNLSEVYGEEIEKQIKVLNKDIGDVKIPEQLVQSKTVAITSVRLLSVFKNLNISGMQIGKIFTSCLNKLSMKVKWYLENSQDTELEKKYVMNTLEYFTLTLKLEIGKAQTGMLMKEIKKIQKEHDRLQADLQMLSTCVP